MLHQRTGPPNHGTTDVTIRDVDVVPVVNCSHFRHLMRIVTTTKQHRLKLQLTAPDRATGPALCRW